MAGEWSASLKPLHQPAVSRDLPETWHWIRLDDACEGVFDCPRSTPNLVDAGPLVVRSQDIITGVFRTEQAAHVSLDTYRERTSKAVPSHGDLLYSREGTYFGIAAEVPDNTKVCLGQRMVLIRPKADVLDFRFLGYWLNSPLMASHIHGYRDGSVAERLNLPTIRALPVAAPPIQEQLAIAHILGTLDDKIELNRRMNETLAEMARALFKSWFVDFDPVHAKAEGRNPGLPKPIADIFTNRLVDSELGEIPEGWEVKKLSDLLELAYGKALKAEDRKEGDVPVYGSNGQVGWHDQRLVAGPGIVVGRKGNPGIITWVPTDFFPIDTTFFVVSKSGCQDLEFLFFALRNHDLASLGADSAVPGLNRNLAYMSNQLRPPAPLIKEFGRIAGRLLRRVDCGANECRSLASLRNVLLPKLISGEMRVKDAEKLIGREV
jgi:type I restriction enzyme, S subunit